MRWKYRWFDFRPKPYSMSRMYHAGPCRCAGHKGTSVCGAIRVWKRQDLKQSRLDKLLDSLGNPSISNPQLVLAQNHTNDPGFQKFSFLGIQLSENVAVIHIFRGILQSSIEVNPQGCILLLKRSPPLGTGLYQRRFPLLLQREKFSPFTGT